MRRHRIHLGDDVREIDFPIGSIVYLKVRDEPVRGIVSGYRISPDDVVYLVVWANSNGEIQHYAIELTAERPVFHPQVED